jgi:hypothetical protein
MKDHFLRQWYSQGRGERNRFHEAAGSKINISNEKTLIYPQKEFQIIEPNEREFNT